MSEVAHTVSGRVLLLLLLLCRELTTGRQKATTPHLLINPLDNGLSLFFVFCGGLIEIHLKTV